MNLLETFDSYLPESRLMEAWGVSKKQLTYMRINLGLPYMTTSKHHRLYPLKEVLEWLDGRDVRNQAA